MKKNIKFVRWDITPYCNLNCRHCYAKGMYGENMQELSLHEIEICMDRICEVGAENIIFYGGEPLIRKDLPEIVSFCDNRNIKSHIITNGTMITRKMVEELANAGLEQIGVSVDATNRTTYTRIRGKDYFSKIIDNIRILVEHPFKVSMGFVLSKMNYTEIQAFIELARDLQVDQVIFIPLAPKGNAEISNKDLDLTPQQYVGIIKKIAETKSELNIRDDFIVMDFAPPLLVDYMNRKYKASLFEEPKWCFAGTGSLFIRTDGRVYPCKGFVEEYADGETSGTYSLLEKSLPEILGGEYFDRVFQLSAPSLLKAGLPHCRDCKYFLKYCKPCPVAASNPDKNIAELCLGFQVGAICEEIKKLEEV